VSPWTILLVVVVALALAVQSVRVLVALHPAQRLGRLVVLAVAAVLGLVVTAELYGWDFAAVGVVVGLAVVELGPTVADVVKRLMRRKGDEQ